MSRPDEPLDESEAKDLTDIMRSVMCISLRFGIMTKDHYPDLLDRANFECMEAAKRIIGNRKLSETILLSDLVRATLTRCIELIDEGENVARRNI